jgi:hypothetical protein
MVFEERPAASELGVAGAVEKCSTFARRKAGFVSGPPTTTVMQVVTH